LLYDDSALDQAWQIVKGWSAAERQQLRDDVPRLGFKASIGNRDLDEIASDCLKLAHAGLRRRARTDRNGRDETCYLEPLDQILEAGLTPAEHMLDKFNGAWNRSIEPVYQEYAF
jgi:glutamate--cysteine ligase